MRSPHASAKLLLRFSIHRLLVKQNPKLKLKQQLERFDEVLFAFLFGSRVRGRPRPNSDWDVGVYLADRLSGKERFEFHLRLATEFEEMGKVDLVILNDAPPLLAQRALQGERIIIRDPQAYVQFFVRTAAAAEDERFWRELHRKARQHRLQEGEFGRP